MSILTSLAKKVLSIPEFREVLLIDQIKDTLHYLSESDLDMLSIAIRNERTSRGRNL